MALPSLGFFGLFRCPHGNHSQRFLHQAFVPLFPCFLHFGGFIVRYRQKIIRIFPSDTLFLVSKTANPLVPCLVSIGVSVFDISKKV